MTYQHFTLVFSNVLIIQCIYLHIYPLSIAVRSVDVPDVWQILLEKCNMFTRDSNGQSGLDCMIENLPVSWSNQYLKSYLVNLKPSMCALHAQ